jgi:hypothetical protein
MTSGGKERLFLRSREQQFPTALQHAGNFLDQSALDLLVEQKEEPCTSDLTNNSDQLKDLLTQIAVSFDVGLRAGSVAINAFGENTPSQLLRYRHSRGEFLLKWFHQMPTSGSLGQTPPPSAIAGDFQQEQSSDGCVNITVCMRQSSRKAIEDRMI